MNSDRPLKIVQVIPHYVPAYSYGGPLRVAHSLGRSLIRLGHTVAVCATNLESEERNFSYPENEAIDVDGVNVHYAPVFLLRNWCFSPALWRRAKHEIARADLVLVHSYYNFVGTAGAYLARRARKPYIIFPHSTLHRQNISHKSTLRKRIYLRVLERENFHGALFLAFNSPEEQASSLFSDLGKVISNGIDPAECDAELDRHDFHINYPQSRDKICILFLGRLDIDQKGLDLLIPAFARLLQSHPEAHLVLAGPSEKTSINQIRKSAKKLKIEHAITLTGLITGPKKAAALNASDVFVLPSRFEGASIALLEALYHNLPVLVTDRVGMCEEINQRGAGLVVQANQEAIYRGLVTLMNSRTRKGMIGKGRHMISSGYTWDAIAQRLLRYVDTMTS